MEDKIFDKNITDSQRLDMIKIIMSTDGLYGILEAFEKEFDIHILEEHSNKVESNIISTNIKDTSIYDQSAIPLVEEDMRSHTMDQDEKKFTKEIEHEKTPILQRKIPNPYMDSKTVTPNE